MYIFKVIKSKSSTEEEFMSALQCAISCIESQFDGDDVVISNNYGDVIVENKVPENSIEISLQECKRKLKDCFCDSEGRIYPEFERVIPPKDSPNK